MFIKDFCKSTNVSIWQIFFRKIYSRLREYKNNICVSEITEKRSQQNSRFSTFEKLAFRSSNSPIWDWWMWNDCDKCCQTWLWLQKMLPWIPLSILAKNPQGSPHESPHLLQVKEWFLEEPFKFQTSSGFLQIRPPILHHYHVLHDATVSDLQVKSTVFHSKWVILGQIWILTVLISKNFVLF